MSWALLRLRLQLYIHPLWMQRWRVRIVRRKLAAVPPAAHGPTLRRLFIDVSVISRNDAGTGIQRIVRAVASSLLANPPAGWEAIPVGATRKRPYHPVAFPTRWTGAAAEPIQGRPGDVFLGLDFSLDDIHRHRRQLVRFKSLGGKAWFVMYDLLPLRHPEWFSDSLVFRYRRWLFALAGLADGFHCISPPVEAELRAVLAERFGIAESVHTSVLPMGWDPSEASFGSGLPEGFDALVAVCTAHPTALMVGTLEPRKGHADVLAAFEELWARGSDARLVIVGHPGWKNDALHQALRMHKRRNAQLFWLENASDEALTALYSACRGVIVASRAEGFGLPLLEALGHGKPVLARDLPVFRLHDGHGVCYFPEAVGVAQLADMIESWLLQPQAAPSPPALSSWADTAAAVASTLGA